MTNHISARLAWHMDGWNGHICKNPAANTYCVGQHSYPGSMIAERRNLKVLKLEQANAGRSCAEVTEIPPCIYSSNAFGKEELNAFADPPEFFKDGTSQKRWKLPPSTVCIWPYEEMYLPEVKKGNGFDYDKRLERAQNYFGQVEENKSLIFYYSNYSNPFSEEENQRYVLVGISRVKKVGDILYYDDASPEIKKRYGGGFIWQLNVSSHYPDEGFRIPYHLYQDQPEFLQKILLTPDNPRNFKFGTRMFTDDDCLDLVERFLEVAATLQEKGDTSENWTVRISWLQKLIAELWQCRGLYPGLPRILDYLEFREAIPFYKEALARDSDKERELLDNIFAFLDGKLATIPGLELPVGGRTREVIRQWQLKSKEEKQLLREVLPRFELQTDQLKRILSSTRAGYGIDATLPEITENPYLLTEQFVGSDPDDTITFNRIDHGMFPSPELGSRFLAAPDDWRRLRALCIERLKREGKHSFMTASQVIHDLNHKLSYLPEWKRHQFTERYLEVDEENLNAGLTFRNAEGDNSKKYLYLRSVYEAERQVEEQIRKLARRADIALKVPLTAERHWVDFLRNPNSRLASGSSREEYEAAIRGQAEVCQKIFVRPICVLSGAAGTGKTTVIRALLAAIERTKGSGASIQLLAPTGKAADIMREKTGKAAATVHSFLAQRGWLNDNMTFKKAGGRKEEAINTYIIDESSMLDLELMAALFRAINWASVQRLIFVGDPNQLPPIGRGKIFADLIDWLTETDPESLGFLQTNIRQMENRLTKRGTGILDLASLFIRVKDGSHKSEAKMEAEQILGRVQEGGDLDQDLRVIYWSDPEDLAKKLIDTIFIDLEKDTGQIYDAHRPSQIWEAAFKVPNTDGTTRWQPEALQIISPYRGEQFGTDYINSLLQKHINNWRLERVGNLGQITFFDKVIQVVNRPKSNPYWAYRPDTKSSEKIEVYNGEIGFTEPHLQDKKKDVQGRVPFVQPWFRLKRFQVQFSRKAQYRVSLDSASEVEQNLELAYAISVHKSQGSEFGRVYFIVPKNKLALLSREMFYTGITRASRHATLLIQEDISPLLNMRRPESSHLAGINSSLFAFQSVPEEFLNLRSWYEEGKIHRTLADIMVRSKSEVIIANMLFEREIPFRYEIPLYAADGTFYLPDFTITYAGEEYYWEHLGMLDQEKYRNHWETKKAWYTRFFPGRLIITEESGNLSKEANEIIEKAFS